MYVYIYTCIYMHTKTQKDGGVNYHYLSWNVFTFLSSWVAMKKKDI